MANHSVRQLRAIMPDMAPFLMQKLLDAGLSAQNLAVLQGANRTGVPRTGYPSPGHAAHLTPVLCHCLCSGGGPPWCVVVAVACSLALDGTARVKGQISTAPEQAALSLQPPAQAALSLQPLAQQLAQLLTASWATG